MLIAAPAAQALAQAGDVGPIVQAGRLVTLGFDDEASVLAGPQRVFFGELFLDEGVIIGDEPGFGSPAGIFADGTVIDVVLRSGVRFFGGTGPVSFGTTDTTLRVFNDTGVGFIDAPAFAPLDPDADDPARTVSINFGSGINDTHLPIQLLDAVGGVTGVQQGFYLLEFDLRSSFAQASLPAFFVFQFGSFDGATVQSVGAFVESNFVPSPSAVALIGLGGALATRRRR
ncbi:MAG: hypothetical protein C0475_07920 [Planctomyces sp.]|nr:hypothetical protein [Planctomyces sp.]MBA4039362.1 hypothetical protein [Planctomyces sp.]